MIFADVTLSTDQVLIYMGAMVAAMASSIALLFRLLMASKDAQIKSLTELGDRAVSNLEIVADKTGGPPKLAPVVPEHNSPPTDAQEMVASLQTLRARLVAAELQLGLPARKRNDE